MFSYWYSSHITTAPSTVDQVWRDNTNATLYNNTSSSQLTTRSLLRDSTNMQNSIFEFLVTCLMYLGQLKDKYASFHSEIPKGNLLPVLASLRDFFVYRHQNSYHTHTIHPRLKTRSRTLDRVGTGANMVWFYVFSSVRCGVVVNAIRLRAGDTRFESR